MVAQEREEHSPVLLEAALDGLAIRPDGIYVDGTFGRGGHAGEILRRLGAAGRLLAFDKDPAAVAVAREKYGSDGRFAIWRGAYTMLERVAQQEAVTGRVNGILLDLGVSSPQLDEPERGFSFRQDGPLDMRMDPEHGPSAAQWLREAKEDEIVRVLRDYGEERFARRIARTIVRERDTQPIERTGRLAELVAAAVPTRERGKHPATRTFQALRIAVNRELEELREVLEQAVRVLAAGGRLCVISFHSLEDRIVKRFMRDMARPAGDLPELPYPIPGAEPRLRLVGRAHRANEAEIAANIRARSAVLRVAEKLA